jgi:hypothetical protein
LMPPLSRCVGLCAHAYGVRKDAANWIFEAMGDSFLAGDVRFAAFFEAQATANGVPLPLFLGANLHQSGTPYDHFGACYQDRRTFKSTHYVRKPLSL